MAKTSSGKVVASTQAWAIVKFSAGHHHRYRFRRKHRYSLRRIPEIETLGSGHCRLHFQGSQIPSTSFKGIRGIVWDIESKGWREALTHLNPKKAFLLVDWTDQDPSWESASDLQRFFQRFFSMRFDEQFLHTLVREQEERFEDNAQQRQKQVPSKFKEIRAKIVSRRRLRL
jgi:hypothetical protein